MDQGRERKLPKWAQGLLGKLRRRIDDLERMREAHAVLSNREWFTLRGPHEGEPDGLKLFVLSRDGAHPVASLYRGDVLLVGRSLDRHPAAKAAL